jgi:putative membrane protein
MGWGNHDYGMWGTGWFGWILMIIFWVAVIIGVMMLIRYLWSAQKQGPSTPDGTDPMRFLKERYAKGDIDKEEFEERKRILEE